MGLLVKQGGGMSKHSSFLCEFTLQFQKQATKLHTKSKLVSYKGPYGASIRSKGPCAGSVLRWPLTWLLMGAQGFDTVRGQ